MDTWIRRACKQRAYRQLVTWIVISLAAIAALVAMHDYWAAFLNGPYAISESNVAALSSFDEAKSFVTVTGSQVVDSGVREYTTETRNGVEQKKYVSSAYSVLLIGNQALVVKGTAPLSATGELKPLPREIPALIFPDAQDAALRSRLYPVMLDTTENYRLTGFVVIGVTLLFTVLFYVFAKRAWGHIQDISTHPVVRRVESWSDAADVATLSEREMSMPRFKRNGVLITDNFVIDRSFFSLNLFPWNHLLWAYRKQTTTRYYFVIPIARSQEAIMHFYGGSVHWRAGKKTVEEALIFAINQAPWAVLGYKPELEQLWTKKNVDFLAAVEARREEVLRPSPLPATVD